MTDHVTPIKRNLHPADELAEVRDTIQRLKDREQELRDILIAAPKAARKGDFFRVSVREWNHAAVALTKLKAHFGMERLQPFIKITECKRVECIPLKGAANA